MRNYYPPFMAVDGQFVVSAVIWTEKGMVNRVKDGAELMKLLTDSGIPIKAYPGSMEDPKNGPFACLILDMTQAELGSNGWDKYVGDIQYLSIDADHLDIQSSV